MDRRFLISIIVTIVLLIAFGYLAHGVLLAADYARVASLYRSQEQQMKHVPFVLLAHVVAAIAIVWLFRRVRDEQPVILQGLRFGLVVAALMVIPKFLIYYAVQPLPSEIVVKQVVFDSIAVMAIGIVLSYLNKR